MTKISQDNFQSLERITVENEQVSFSLLPQIGGKMISLILKENDHEYISSSERPFRIPTYGANFADYDISGFDECFPAIAEGFYPEEPWKGVHIPDHGELWTLPWESEIEGETLRLTVFGVRFPYRFVKVFTLEENRVEVNYQVTNFSPVGFKYIWAAHPLLAVTPGTKITLPGEPRIRTDWSKNERLGRLLYETSWPRAQGAGGEVIDLSIVNSPEVNQATKFFTTVLEQGWCALHDPLTGNFLKFSFPVEKIPYVGVWINEGGWPLEGQPSYNVALEPCTGCPDKLDTAIQRDEYASLKGHGENTWTLVITVGRSEQVGSIRGPNFPPHFESF